MMSVSARGALTRRGLIGTLAAGPLIRHARAAPPPELTLILMADLHSGYRWSARLLAAVRREAEAARGETRIVVNGDVFEHNNAVSRRNDGRIDRALIRALAGIAPTIVTIGNHDSDLFDPRQFAQAVRDAGATLLTDVADPRSGALYGDAATTIRTRRLTVGLAALGTPNMAVYPAAFRADYRVPDPAAYAAQRLPALFGSADLHVALVHAGFMADRSVLPSLKPPFLLHGSHDHLRFSERFGPGAMHLHSGAWSSSFQMVTLRATARGPVLSSRDVLLDAQSPEDPALASLIAGERAAHLDASDRAVLGTLPKALPLDRAVLWLAAHLRDRTGADLALLSHTTFGDGLPQGAVTAEDRASFLRFDGGVSLAEIDGATLARTVLPRTNQFDGSTAYARRIGDYLYATSLSPEPTRRYRVAINAYAASTPGNRRALLGADLPGFAPIPGLTLGALIDGALKA